MEVIALGLLVVLTLSMSLLVETSSWCVRVHAALGNIGTFIARTNIYLYGGRFFAILTQVVVGFLVDQGADSRNVLHVFLFAFAASALVHVLALGRKSIRAALNDFLLRFMRLDKISPQLSNHSGADVKLYVATTVTATFFSIALMAPLVLASAFPEYRLTLNNAGSLINFLGMLVLLGYLDPLMYRALDEGSIAHRIDSYIWGRVTGFAVCASLLMVFLWVL